MLLTLKLSILQVQIFKKYLIRYFQKYLIRYILLYLHQQVKWRTKDRPRNNPSSDPNTSNNTYVRMELLRVSIGVDNIRCSPIHRLYHRKEAEGESRRILFRVLWKVTITKMTAMYILLCTAMYVQFNNINYIKLLIILNFRIILKQF